MSVYVEAVSLEERWRLIGARLREARKAQALTLKDVSAATRVSVPQISEFERGLSLGSFISMVRVCRAVDLSLDDLVEGVTL